MISCLSVFQAKKIEMYRTVIFPLVLYGWREEYSLRVFENRVLMKIFGPKKDEVTREWRRLHKEELYHLCFLPIG
jgi:hypothetical protein